MRKNKQGGNSKTQNPKNVVKMNPNISAIKTHVYPTKMFNRRNTKLGLKILFRSYFKTHLQYMDMKKIKLKNVNRYVPGKLKAKKEFM